MPILFKSDAVAEQFERADPELRAIVTELAAWCEARDIIEPLVTCLERDEAENAKDHGVVHSHHLDRPCRAVDLRSSHYSEWEAERVEAWLRHRCPKDAYELVLTPHGTGPHYHVAVKRPTPQPPKVS